MTPDARSSVIFAVPLTSYFLAWKRENRPVFLLAACWSRSDTFRNDLAHSDILRNDLVPSDMFPYISTLESQAEHTEEVQSCWYSHGSQEKKSFCRTTE